MREPENVHRSVSLSSIPQEVSTGQIKGMTNGTTILRSQDTSVNGADPKVMTATGFRESRLGSFHSKIRSIWSSKESKKSSETLNKKQSTLEPTSQSSTQRVKSCLGDKSTSSPSLNMQPLNMQPSTSANSLSAEKRTVYQATPAYTGLEDQLGFCQIRDPCNQWFSDSNSSIQLVSKLNSAEAPKMSRNFKQSLYEKVAAKETIDENGYKDPKSGTCKGAINQQSQHRFVEVKRGSANASVPVDNEDSHVVVVSCLESPSYHDQCLTVRSHQPLEVVLENDSLQSEQGSAVQSPSSNNVKSDNEREGSAASNEATYKSSSDSGRGTMRSDGSLAKHDGNRESSLVDMSSLDSDHSSGLHNRDKPNTVTCERPSTDKGMIEKMQLELQRILNDEDLGNKFDMKLSDHLDSDSWMSDSSSSRKQPELNKHNYKAQEAIKFDPPKVHLPLPLPPPPLKGQAICKQEKITSAKQPIQLTNRKVSIKPVLNQAANLAPVRTPRIYSSVKTKPTTHVHKKKWRNSIDYEAVSTTTGGMDSGSEYPDDKFSEYTANTDCLDQNEVHAIKKHIKGLEGMYSEVSN